MDTHMTSSQDAFRFFDLDSKGHLTNQEFRSLILELFEKAGEAVPSYHVIKHLFDYIDKKKDGHIDKKEWN